MDDRFEQEEKLRMIIYGIVDTMPHGEEYESEHRLWWEVHDAICRVATHYAIKGYDIWRH